MEIKSDLKLLYKLDNWHGIYALLVGYIIILISIIFVIYNHLLYPVALLVIASRQRALATIQHEASHFVLAKNRLLNRILGDVFAGSLIFQGFNTYMKSHVRCHHIFLGDKENDPDYKYYLELGLYRYRSQSMTYSPIFKLLKITKYITTYIGYLFRTRIFMPQINIDTITIIGINCVIISMLFMLHLLIYYVLFWLIPLFIFFPIIGWFIEVAEHYPLVNDNDVDIYMTRNRFSHTVEALFLSMHNENYHLVHHLKPGIPFWNLKKAHAVLLKDHNYMTINNSMGGVFISKNKEKTVFNLLLKNI
jgi:fatty acid desaturase